ncbi:MAG TPA: tripartite tricarboxylate transporter substrate binding protein [Ramlibacter sp.]|nr:tripartite tricarboxylate transporter substrate binding protein [Ramlibacter sp.]
MHPNKLSVRRSCLRSGLALAAGLTGLLGAPAAMAQDYPTKPIRLVVGFATGSTTDTLARLVALKMGESLAQQIVVDNRAGAGGNIGADQVAKAAPDGYTLLLVPSSHAINPSLYSNLPFKTESAFASIGLIGEAPLLLVAHPSFPANNVKELIELAKSKPGTLNYASGGVGSPSHLAMEVLRSTAGISITHVPFKGGNELLTALVGGQVQMTPTGMLIGLPLVKSGRVKPLAVTGSKRVAIAPEVPTVAESGVPGYAVTGWWGLLAPAGTPPAIVARLNRELVKVLNTPDVRDKLRTDGIEGGGGTPEEFDAFIKRELVKWGKAVKESGAKVE